MKKSIVTLLLICLCSTPAFALLAPLHQSIREFDAVVTSKELPNYLDPNDKLVDIKREGDTFTVVTENKEVIIDLTYTPTTRVGPKEFTLKFREANK